MSSDLPGLQNCPVCSEPLNGHRYALLASIIDNPNDKARSAKFLNDIKNRTWSEVLQPQEWQGDSDMFELYALRCPLALLALILVRDPFELFDSKSILCIEPLTAHETETLAPLISQKNWKPLP